MSIIEFTVEELLVKGDYDKIVSVIQTSENLEGLKLNNCLKNIFSYFESNLQYERINDILTSIANYKKKVFELEFKEGINILLAHK